MDDAELQTYAFSGGGPLARVERRLHIQRDAPGDLERRVGVAIALAYIPLLAVGIRGRIVSGAWPLAVHELTGHARALVMVPLLLVAERLIDMRVAGAGRYLFRSLVLGEPCFERHRSGVARLSRLRDSALVEASLFVASVLAQLVLPAPTRDNDLASAWGLQPSLVLYRFLLLRLLWHWCLWTFYLLQLSRLPLDLRATHPDRAAGLAPLAEPSIMFGLGALGGAAGLAARWGDFMRFEGAHASAFYPLAVVNVMLALFVAAAPLWVFTRRLIQIRNQGVRDYGALANRYADAFEKRWFDRTGEETLGASDIQTLNDLGGSFERVQQIGVVLAPRAMVIAVVGAATLPLTPLIVAEVGASQLLMQLAKALF